MRAAFLLLALAFPARAADLGGHLQPRALDDEGSSVDDRRSTLEEMWQRGLLPPDQSAWAPADIDLLRTIRRVEGDAMPYLRRRFAEDRAWIYKAKIGKAYGPSRLTKEGYEKYWSLLTQDAVGYFESKGVDAKFAFKLRTPDDKPLFDGSGRLTAEGARVYHRAALNLETFWKGPDGRLSGTRRPPVKNP